jgi:hypothetical protein
MVQVLRQVWVIQDERSGNFLGEDLQFHLSLAQAGRCTDALSARDTAICQLSYEYLIHTFWEMQDDC